MRGEIGGETEEEGQLDDVRAGLLVGECLEGNSLDVHCGELAS